MDAKTLGAMSAAPTDVVFGNRSIGCQGGLTKREALAMAAPKKPQPWFKPKMTTEKPDGNHNLAGAIRWNDEYDRQRHIQWPTAWADALLAELAKEQP